MKNNRIFSKALCLLIAVMLMLVPVSVFAAAESHNHIDENSDSVCDVAECGAEIVKEPTILDNVLESLKMFVIGMIGIFVVVGIIIIVIYALTRFIDGAPKKQS